MSESSGGAAAAAGACNAIAAGPATAAAAAQKNKGGRPPKPIWQHFHRSDYDTSKGSKKADGECKFCHKVFKQANPATLQAHIAECKSVEDDVRRQALADLSSQAAPLQIPVANRAQLNKRRIGSPLTNHFGSAQPFADDEQERLNFVLLRALIDTGASFRLADNPFFLQWVDELSSQRYTPAGKLSIVLCFQGNHRSVASLSGNY